MGTYPEYNSSSDRRYLDDPYVIRKDNNKKIEADFIGFNSPRTFQKTAVTGNKSLAAATMKNLVSVLKTDQLRQCGLAYVNNGVVRTVIDRSVYFIHGDRSTFVIEPNDELTEGASDQELKKLEEEINNSDDIKQLRRKLVRCNKRVKLLDRSQKLLASCLIFGRNALAIERFPTGTNSEGQAWNMFGEPLALKHLSSLRIKDIMANEKTGVLEGLTYDDNMATSTGPKTYKSTDLIPAFHDDNNILDNSNYSGLSAIWPVLEAANSIEAIISEDIPEMTRQLHAKFGIMYAGTSKKSTLRKLKEELESSTWLIHNEPALQADVHDLARDPMEAMNVVNALSKYICQGMSLPLFLLFEDTANFATANQTMQTYKAGMLKRYRTWFQGILEDYWYDPILADHLGIELKDVISAPIKIKAIFPDINFETRLDVITADAVLFDKGVMNEIEFAKDIDRKDIANRLELEVNELGMSVENQRKQDIAEAIAGKAQQNKEEGQQQDEEDKDESQNNSPPNEE